MTRTRLVAHLVSGLALLCIARAAAAAPCTSSTCCTGGNYCWLEDVTRATPVYVASATFSPGQRIRALAGNFDPVGTFAVMHLSYGDMKHEVAYNDNCPGSGGTAVCVDYTVPLNKGGAYYLIIYAYGPNYGGRWGMTFALYSGGTYVGTFTTGGYAVSTYQTAQESFETVLVNDGSKATGLARLDWNGNHYEPKDYKYASGVGLGSRLWGNGSSKWLIASASWGAQDEGPVRAIRNDGLLLDTDQDGLGNYLENELCICNQMAGMVCGFDCSAVADARDTDGDGLPDFWEVTGCESNAARTDTPPQQQCPQFFTGLNNPQYLPLWGASPRHKDIFVEVDRAGWEANPAPVFETALAEWAAQRYSVLKNQQNPDAVDGVNVHYDVDHDCEVPGLTHGGITSDGITSICGQMGGASIIPTGVGGGCDGSLKDTNMARERWGIFHWAGRQYGSSGSAGYGDSLCFGSPADVNAAHEMGHNFGLQHWGAEAASDVHRKPNYVSLMSYSYGYYDATTNQWFQEGSPDPHANFSDGSRASVPLSPVNLPELSAYAPSVDISGFCEEPYLYDCSNGSVDWNRDGLYSGGGIRAYLGTDTRGRAWSGDDMPIIQGESRITGLTSTLGVGAAVLRDIYSVPHIVVVANESGDFRMTRSQGGGWTAWTSLNGPGFRPDSQPFAVTFQATEGLRTFVFGARPDGTMWYASIRPDWTVSAWTQLGGTPGGVTFKEASATDWADSGGIHRLVVVARQTSGPAAASDVYYGYFNAPMDWNGWYVAQVAGGPTIQSQISPAVANGPDGRYYMVLKAPPGDLDRPNALKLYAADTSGWMNLANGNNAVWWGDDQSWENVIDRPAMVYRPHLNAAGQAMARGALWLYYPVQGQPGVSSYQDFRFTWGPFSATENDFGGNLSMGRFYHQGRWDTADYFGSALVENGLNLAAVLPPKTTDPGFMFYPYADGQVTPLSGRLINDFDDHAAIRDNLCKAIRGCSDWCAGSPPCQERALTSLPPEGENLCGPPPGVAR